MSENLADLHTLHLEANVLRRYGGNIETRPAQIDRGREVEFTPGRSIVVIHRKVDRIVLPDEIQEAIYTQRGAQIDWKSI